MTPLPKKRIPLKLKEEILADLNLFFDSSSPILRGNYFSGFFNSGLKKKFWQRG